MNVPDHITLEQIQNAVRALGFDPNDVQAVSLSPRPHVTVTYFDGKESITRDIPIAARSPQAAEIPSCQVTVWDGAYAMTCGHFMPNGECIRHGKPRN